MSDGEEGGGGRDGGRGDDGETRDGGRQSDQQEQTSTAEKALIAISVAFTLFLFAYAGWQIVTPPQTDVPQASVVGTERLADGSVAVSVRLRNPADVGLVTATVESNCTTPPPSIEYSYVPASSNRTGTLVCPAGTTDPSVSVSNWMRR